MTKCDCVCIPREEYEKLKGCVKASRPKPKKKRKSAPKPKVTTPDSMEVAIVEPMMIPETIPEPKVTRVRTSKAKSKKTAPKKTAPKKTMAIAKPKTTKKKKSSKSKAKAKAKKPIVRSEPEYERPLKYALPQIPYNGAKVERREKKVKELPAPRQSERIKLSERKAITSFKDYLQRRGTWDAPNLPRELPKLEFREKKVKELPAPKSDAVLERRKPTKALPPPKREPLALPPASRDASFQNAIQMDNCDDLPIWQRRACRKRNRQRVE